MTPGSPRSSKARIILLAAVLLFAFTASGPLARAVQNGGPAKPTGAAKPGGQVQGTQRGAPLPSPPAAASNAANQSPCSPRPNPPREEWTWWKDDAVKKAVNLSERQSQKIDQIYKQRLADLGPTATELSKQQDDLERIVCEHKITPEELRLVAVKVQALRSEVGVSRTVMLYKMDLVLSADQRSKLPEIFKKHFEGRRGGGPGRF